MAVYKSKGIVLGSIRYSEADRILDLYTQDMGLVSAIAKGIRRTASRFGGRLEPLSCVDFLAYEGRTLDTITQVEVLRSFHSVRESLTRLQTAGAMVAMDLSKIVVRLYSQTEDPAIQSQCLALIDDMETHHFYGLSDELRRLDR